MDARDLQRLFKAHIRQNGGDATREQCLARARRPNEQYIVPARGGNFQRAFGGLLALDVHEIRARRALGHELIVGNRNQRLNGTLAGKMRHHLFQVPGGKDGDSIHTAYLHGVRLRKHNGAQPQRASGQHHWQHAAHRLNGPIERKLAHKRHAHERRAGDIALAGQEANRNGQIETRAFLFPIGGREIDRDALLGHFIAAVQNGRLYALAGFTHGGIRQAHDFERGHAKAHVHLRAHRKAINPGNAKTRDDVEHRNPILSRVRNCTS